MYSCRTAKPSANPYNARQMQESGKAEGCTVQISTPQQSIKLKSATRRKPLNKCTDCVARCAQSIINPLRASTALVDIPVAAPNTKKPQPKASAYGCSMQRWKNRVFFIDSNFGISKNRPSVLCFNILGRAACYSWISKFKINGIFGALRCDPSA